jgi:hypothetical protein
MILSGPAREGQCLCLAITINLLGCIRNEDRNEGLARHHRTGPSLFSSPESDDNHAVTTSYTKVKDMRLFEKSEWAITARNPSITSDGQGY